MKYTVPHTYSRHPRNATIVANAPLMYMISFSSLLTDRHTSGLAQQSTSESMISPFVSMRNFCATSRARTSPCGDQPLPVYLETLHLSVCFFNSQSVSSLVPVDALGANRRRRPDHEHSPRNEQFSQLTFSFRKPGVFLRSMDVHFRFSLALCPLVRRLEVLRGALSAGAQVSSVIAKISKVSTQGRALQLGLKTTVPWSWALERPTPSASTHPTLERGTENGACMGRI